MKALNPMAAHTARRPMPPSPSPSPSPKPTNGSGVARADNGVAKWPAMAHSNAIESIAACASCTWARGTFLIFSYTNRSQLRFLRAGRVTPSANPTCNATTSNTRPHTAVERYFASWPSKLNSTPSNPLPNTAVGPPSPARRGERGVGVRAGVTAQ